MIAVITKSKYAPTGRQLFLVPLWWCPTQLFPIIAQVTQLPISAPTIVGLFTTPNTPSVNVVLLTYILNNTYNGMWCDMMWCDAMWCDEMWCDVMWCDVMRCDAMGCDVKWCEIMWCDANNAMRWDVMWNDVKWCDVMWCDVMRHDVT